MPPGVTAPSSAPHARTPGHAPKPPSAPETPVAVCFVRSRTVGVLFSYSLVRNEVGGLVRPIADGAFPVGVCRQYQSTKDRIIFIIGAASFCFLAFGSLPQRVGESSFCWFFLALFRDNSGCLFRFNPPVRRPCTRSPVIGFFWVGQCPHFTLFLDNGPKWAL